MYQRHSRKLWTANKRLSMLMLDKVYSNQKKKIFFVGGGGKAVVLVSKRIMWITCANWTVTILEPEDGK